MSNIHGLAVRGRNILRLIIILLILLILLGDSEIRGPRYRGGRTYLGPGWDIATEHGSSADRVKVLRGVFRASPVRLAVVVAAVPIEEGADAFGAEIRDAKFARTGEDNGVRKHETSRLETALNIAQNVEAAAGVIAEVAEGLHHLCPAGSVVCPAGIAVELLIISDEWLDKNPLALTTSAQNAPDQGNVEPDDFVKDVSLIEPVNKFQRLIHSLDVKGEEVFGEDATRFEPFGDRRLASPRANRVDPPAYPAK